MPDPRSHALDAVYSEAEVADMRLKWEQATKEQQFSNQLSTLSGQLSQLTQHLPVQMEAVARRVVIEVLAEEERKRKAGSDRKWLRGDQMAAIFQALTAILMLYLVIHK